MGNWAKTFGEYERNNCKNKWGVGVGGVGGIVVLVRASISKPTPFIYLAFEKTDLLFSGKIT